MISLRKPMRNVEGQKTVSDPLNEWVEGDLYFILFLGLCTLYLIITGVWDLWIG